MHFKNWVEFSGFVDFFLTSTIWTQERTNTNVWIIIKICKALNPSFWVVLLVFCFQWQSASPSPSSRLQGKNLLASSPYVQSSSRFLKVLSQSHGFSHHFLLPRVGVFTFLPYRKQRKHRLSLLTHSRLATNLHPHPSVLSIASTEGPGGWCPAEVLGSEGLTTWSPLVLIGAWR